MDRCALFVDASYVLADGAMAVHGTRRGESVSWDYEGLLQLLGGMARERTGLPLLRCYWYEATVDGRRSAEQDALADIPGIKLRVAKIRPGRREGVETEIHRDLTTLARNGAVSDALVVSAEEDLAQVIADVQDLGMRVTLVHIAVDGNWTISRSLRQESDDIIEIGGEQLRPYVELIVGAEPAHADEPDDADRAPGRPLANGHSAVAGVGSYQALPTGSGNHAPPSIYTAPVVAEYQRPALQLPRAASREDRASREERPRDREERTRDREERTRDERPRESVNGDTATARPDIYAAPAPVSPRTRQDRPDRAEPARVARVTEDVTGYAVPPVTPDGLAGPEASPAPPGQLRRLPARPNTPNVPNAPNAPIPLGPIGSPPGGGPSGPQHVAQHAGQGSPRSAPYSGPQPVATSAPPGYVSAGGPSLSEAVQAAHEEGQEFGASVARDAPALWLEAVLARKPRMPSDLEARLLQGSALPIDFLLHDEVRHALRRGFWDALERTRR
ncbi:MAG TPA: NYN domain-containing protein [Streptosporangiaceae bacterium]|nr:NYN domain-containing protein [Streptosporangiaceae bacterium]